MDADVVVVGAGLAGLRCATRLAEGGRDVVVLEAEEVVGGRQRTDVVDGFLLDRGFQVLNPAYPAVRRWVDVEALDLRHFGPGVLVRRDRGLVRLTHPLRDPSGVPATLRSGLVAPSELLALARWAGPAVVAPRRVLRGPDRPWRAGLDAAGARGALRAEVLEPFLAGVLAEDAGETSESFVRLLVRMFALGLPGLPADGIRALPAQLADRLPPDRVAVRRSTRAAAVRDTGSGAVVELEAGGRLVAGAVVVAVGPEAVGALVDVPPPTTKGLRTWWFAADEAPTDSDLLAVDGRRNGLVVNLAVVSNAAPSYAPQGRHLVEATCLLPAGAPASSGASGGSGGAGAADEAVVRRQVGEVLGADTAGWTLLRRDDVPHALPVQAPPLRTTSSPFVARRVLVCGDHRDTASIQGALVSGHRVAGAVLDVLGPRA